MQPAIYVTIGGQMIQRIAEFNIFVNIIRHVHCISNNDVFVHVRLEDVIHLNPGFQYYDSVLRDLQGDYYITEKIDNALRIGRVPIYWDSSNIDTIIHPKRFLHIRNDARDYSNDDR